ncbi:helix-turn-helix domain-containing protein [Streptomyces sp. NPDC016562]
MRFRRAMILLASAGRSSSAPAIARLAQADEDTARAVIHRFNAIGLGRP